jgi:Cys-rich protein (TIGR01571 family)
MPYFVYAWILKKTGIPDPICNGSVGWVVSVLLFGVPCIIYDLAYAQESIINHMHSELKTTTIEASDYRAGLDGISRPSTSATNEQHEFTKWSPLMPYNMLLGILMAVCCLFVCVLMVNLRTQFNRKLKIQGNKECCCDCFLSCCCFPLSLCQMASHIKAKAAEEKSCCKCFTYCEEPEV